ncbi:MULTISPECIES: hypothetical protein [unclassified Roseitalea]|uniref:hypothetical protein n=1 Tax=unclassified Roseitalea TaxID=2639107 RepID=UPI00273F2465|nr:MULTISPECIES: hypothetical protein [unclassified Roseitalea]
MRAPLARAGIVLAVCLPAGAAMARPDLPTAPKAAVRSLHHIQDAIAGGDAAAFTMQTSTLRVVDALFANLRPQALDDADTRKALFVYAVSGGNPRTFARLYPPLSEQLEGRDKRVLNAVAATVLRRPVGEEGAVSPREAGGMLGGGLALLAGINASDLARRIAHLDDARLLAPGTLIEESALRRLIGIHGQDDDPERFFVLSSRYVRTFVTSPYASDFAETFTAAAARLTQPPHHARLGEIVGFMPPAHRRAIVVRLMRAATVRGNFALVRSFEDRFGAEVAASARGGTQTAEAQTDAARKRLFSLMAGIASEDHDTVARALERIDADQLMPADRQLLEAARAITRDIGRPATADGVQAGAPGASRFGTSADPLLPPDLPVATDAETLDPELESFITNARSVLEGVDALLEETAQ